VTDSDVITALVARICEAGRDAVAAGLVVASGGNISAREPRGSDGDVCRVTGAGTWLDRLTPDDVARVRVADGAVLAGPAPSTELALHLATYRARPDVQAVVHLHPQFAILLDSLGEPVRLITTDHAFYLRRIARTPFHSPNSAELAAVAAEAVLDGTNCVILAHHGCSVLGDDLAMAYRRAVNLEEAARLTYRALLLTGGLPGRDVVECPWDLPDAGLI
jgi:ribulose-5-phosphate 4-epimerase/fuculose-1-phosphate aldolase